MVGRCSLRMACRPVPSQCAARPPAAPQERERERAEEQRKAREAAALLHKAAGGYGGGSGPLRGADGKPITDLNQARGLQMAGGMGLVLGIQSNLGVRLSLFAWLFRHSRHSNSLSCYAAAFWHPQVRRYQESRSQPASPAAGSPAQGPGSIGAYWGGGGGTADGAAWAAQPHAPEQPHLAALQRAPSGMAGGPEPGAALPQHASVQGCWAEPPPGVPANLPPAAPSGTAASFSPTKPAPHEALSGMAGGGEQPTLRLRSDRPFQTASEAERRRREQAEFQVGGGWRLGGCRGEATRHGARSLSLSICAASAGRQWAARA